MHSQRFAHRFSITLGALLLSVAAACGSDGPTAADRDIRSADALHFLRPAASAPPLSNPVVQFYAKQGENREAFIYYQPRPGTTDSSEFMRFRVPGSSLALRPDGTPILLGDSILITIRVVDPARLILDFQPSGLRFAAASPADLKIRFREANHDFDGDGDEDADDVAHKQELSIWRQEAPGLPWFRLSSVVELTLEEVEADILGFTGYALAY